MGSMHQADLLTDAARRPVDSAKAVLADISAETLHAMPGGSNSIAWLVWHAARQQDAQISHLSGEAQVWEAGWEERLGVARGADDIGFGDTPEEVAALRIVEPSELLAYLEAVVSAVVAYVIPLDAAALGEVVDHNWDPPVTRGVRVISTIDDAVAHVAQAAYARGVVEGWRVGY